MDPIKIGLLGVWAVSIASFFIGTDSSFAAAGRATFYLLVVAHLAEIAIFRAKLQAAPGGMARNAWPTFVFGIFHVRTLD